MYGKIGKRGAVKMKDIARALSMLTQIGVSMFVPIFMCVLVGAWLDKVTNLSPLFLIIFIILGVGAAFRTIYMMVRKYWE